MFGNRFPGNSDCRETEVHRNVGEFLCINGGNGRMVNTDREQEMQRRIGGPLRSTVLVSR